MPHSSCPLINATPPTNLCTGCSSSILAAGDTFPLAVTVCLEGTTCCEPSLLRFNALLWSSVIAAFNTQLSSSLGRRLEKVNLRSIRSIAKIFGTIICAGGAMCMRLLKGQKLGGMEIPTKTSYTSFLE